MEFSGEYLSYEEYKDLGGTLNLLPFNLLEFEARRKINLRTFNRLVGITEIPQEVKLCEFKMINSIGEYISTNQSNGNVASENIDGYSVSYITGSQIEEAMKSKNAELDDIITTYLGFVIVNGQHLIYCGI